MNFNTITFFFFFLVVYLVYRKLPQKLQNWFLLAASYIFYAYWDWRFLFLLIFSTFINFYYGRRIFDTEDVFAKKRLLTIVVVLNLVILGFFKYFNFFANSLLGVFSIIGLNVDPVTLNIILPLGISFYTLQAMSYPIDIHRKLIEPEDSFRDFSLFVAFFPQLVAGPIERARNLIPQIRRERVLEEADMYEGLWLIFWGLFKKIVIADNLANITGIIFGDYAVPAGAVALIGTLAFSVQVYADFSGYSNMARGIARMLGFRIMKNFALPFFSKDLYSFWQNWHISLTTWVKEYIYYPLALKQWGDKKISAPLVILISWAIMGLWHGPSWKFIMWGVYHAVLLIIYSRVRPYLKKIAPEGPVFQKAWVLLQTLTVFTLFSMGILYFACGDLLQVGQVYISMFRNIFLARYVDMELISTVVLLIAPLFVIEILQKMKDDEFAVLKLSYISQTVIYYVMFYLIVIIGDFSAQRYYYFQF